MSTGIEAGFSISVSYDGFEVGKFIDDKPVNYCKPQGCWINQCWVITPENENNPVLLNFYSKDKERITDSEIMAMANDMSAEDYAKVYNSKGSPIFNVCWDDFLPPSGMFIVGMLSYTWRFYTVLKSPDLLKP